MIVITRRFMVEIAHRLTGLPEPHPEGRLHGHNLAIDLTFMAKATPSPLTANDHAAPGLPNGMVLDSMRIDHSCAPVIRRIDHQHLNELDLGGRWDLVRAQPTLEHLAWWLWHSLGFMSRGDDFKLSNVRVYANDRLWVDYSE